MSYVGRYLDPILVERLNRMSLLARRLVEGTTGGVHASSARGASVEFRQHRIYAPGDELRHLDWRILAKTDRPYLREYEHESNLRCVLALDASGSMAYAGNRLSKFDYAKQVMAALAYLMLANGENVGAAVMGQSLSHWAGPRGGRGQLARILQTAERTAPTGPGNPPDALARLAERLDRRSLVIYISDCLCPVDVLARGLARLAHQKHEVLLIRVLDRDEIEFPFKSWMRFRGLENEGAQLLEPALARRVYLARFDAHAQALAALCRTLHIRHHRFETNISLDQHLTAFLKEPPGRA